MPNTRTPYASELRRHMVDLARAGRDPDDLAHELEPTAQSICNWVAVAGSKRAAGPRETILFSANQNTYGQPRRAVQGQADPRLHASGPRRGGLAKCG